MATSAQRVTVEAGERKALSKRIAEKELEEARTLAKLEAKREAARRENCVLGESRYIGEHRLQDKAAAKERSYQHLYGLPPR